MLDKPAAKITVAEEKLFVPGEMVVRSYYCRTWRGPVYDESISVRKWCEKVAVLESLEMGRSLVIAQTSAQSAKVQVDSKRSQTSARIARHYHLGKRK